MKTAVEMHDKTRKFDLIYLNTYQSAQIIEFPPLKMVGHVSSATNLSRIMKKGKCIQKRDWN